MFQVVKQVHFLCKFAIRVSHIKRDLYAEHKLLFYRTKSRFFGDLKKVALDVAFFLVDIKEANQLGFIHEGLGHVLCDLSIGGYSPDTDIMKYVEVKIRKELNWQFTTRSLESEAADLSGHYCNLEELK